MIKTIAIYLPQFHRTPENDEWWGAGFTEWTAVKNAKPLFEGHNQPRVPLDNRYYNLLEKSVMQWQVELARKYKIGGFCFYHYWFEHGRKILEKPAENLLSWKDIDMPFCFSWANESWIRTWGNIHGGNAWAPLYEQKDDEGKGILLKQAYGSQKEWTEHFDYLLPFFKDERYIKIDGKPIFIIYRPSLIPSYCRSDMLELWEKKAVEEGFPGIYYIGQNCVEGAFPILDAKIDQEPKSYFSKMSYDGEQWEKKGNVRMLSYDKLWKDFLERQYGGDEKVFLGGVVDYDCTPRRGEKGTALTGVTSEKFHTYFDRLVQKSIRMGNEFVFLNAWNEWGEGMYLEPDTSNGYAYLEAVRDVMDKYENVTLPKEETHMPIKNVDAVYMEELEKKDKKIAKFLGYFSLMSSWMTLKEQGKNLEEFFVNQKISRIAIYGVGVLGKHLLAELKNSKFVKVEYGIDRGAELAELAVYKPQDKLPKTQMIVVTAVFDFEYIKNSLKEQVDVPIISLEEIVDQLVSEV